MNPHMDALEMGAPYSAKLSSPQALRRPRRASACTRRTRIVSLICSEPGTNPSRSKIMEKNRFVSASRWAL
ncbi:Uncharacterised protein [Mycobacteroides abscessus subsp. massiliense]|nr:Uncharacterised protein [Mycobacteroides abscessus subsp. massiliense]